MGESTQQLEWNIAAERQELGRNLHALERKANALKDWRTYYRQHPMAVVAVAFGGAMMVGLLARNRSRMDSTSTYGTYDNDYPVADTSTRQMSNAAGSPSRLRREVGNTWDHIADALMGVASATAIDFVSQTIPGFGEEYTKRHPEYGGSR